MPSTYSIAGSEDQHALAWDTQSNSEAAGALYQPWREFWPPNVSVFSKEELASKPWLTWKRDASRPNEKPWYDWVNIFAGEVDSPCEGDTCPHCNGAGCNVCSTVAEGG
ncbi:hypothetical protein B0T24DRAFT_235626 [Lasiosphaeria ovina]|uniref:Uncharacterized protein n=1 Tax=Lasiosphaeria ovina TaxID=92902 RepID=A0AAE0KJ32_9PEZI|nr:hypothetical protein B0T24DRAFT_235626 [Lasiosphaeria ovina]